MIKLLTIICIIMAITLAVFVFLTFTWFRAFQALSYYIKEQGHHLTKADVMRCMNATSILKGSTVSK